MIKNKIINDNSNDFTETLVAPVDVQSSIIITNNNEEREEYFIEETTQNRDQIAISSMKQSNRPPSFKQLQSLVAKANDIQEEPNATPPIASLDIQKEHPEEQQFYKKSFPSTGINPSQLYTGRNSNVPMTSAIQLNTFAKKQRIPIKVMEKSALSFSLATSDTEKNETATEYSDEVIYVAPIEVVNAPFEISREKNDIDPIEVEIEPIEIPIKMNDVAPIAVVNAPIGIPIEVNDSAPIEVVNAPIEIPIEVNDSAPIEVVNAPIEIPIEVNDGAPIEEENAPIEIPIEVNEVAPIEEENAPIEISTVLKRQQHKNKEKFWLFNLFSKKH